MPYYLCFSTVAAYSSIGVRPDFVTLLPYVAEDRP